MNFKVMVLLCGLLVAVVIPVPSRGQDCSGNVCSDCKNDPDTQIASCITVSRSASCTCSINVNTPKFCTLDRTCTYTGGGGGGGLPGGGSGGGSCTILPGQFCPTDCMSCQVVYWY